MGAAKRIYRASATSALPAVSRSGCSAKIWIDWHLSNDDALAARRWDNGWLWSLLAKALAWHGTVLFAGLAGYGGSTSVAFAVHVDDGGVVDETVDGGDRHLWNAERSALFAAGWLAVTSRDRRSYPATMGSSRTDVSVWSQAT